MCFLNSRFCHFSIKKLLLDLLTAKKWIVWTILKLFNPGNFFHSNNSFCYTEKIWKSLFYWLIVFQEFLSVFKFWWEKSRLGIFFPKILKWFLHHSKDYLRYQKVSMGPKVFIFVNKFEVCLFSMNLRAHKKHWVLFLRLKTKNIVKL